MYFTGLLIFRRRFPAIEKYLQMLHGRISQLLIYISMAITSNAYDESRKSERASLNALRKLVFACPLANLHIRLLVLTCVQYWFISTKTHELYYYYFVMVGDLDWLNNNLNHLV
jgi:hypothetical protein